MNLLTASFIEQLIYHTSVREALVGVDPNNSELVFEMRQYRRFSVGSAFLDGMEKVLRARDMRNVIKMNHQRVKGLVSMMGDSDYDDEDIASYIAELYRQSVEAVESIGELDG